MRFVIWKHSDTFGTEFLDRYAYSVNIALFHNFSCWSLFPDCFILGCKAASRCELLEKSRNSLLVFPKKGEISTY